MKTRNYSISRLSRENFFHLNEITFRCYKDVLSIAMSCKSSIKCLALSQRCKTPELLIILYALISKHSSTRCLYWLFHRKLSGFVVTSTFVWIWFNLKVSRSENEWNMTTAYMVWPLLTAACIHIPVDCRCKSSFYFDQEENMFVFFLDTIQFPFLF